LVSITTLGATSSQAAIIKRFSKQPIEQGDLACLEETGASQLVRTIRLLPRNGASTSEERALLQGVENALKQRDSFLQIAADGLRADFAVSLNDNNEYVVSDSTDREIPHLFSGSRADRSGAANLLVERLTHLAKYLNVNELENFDPHSPLRLKLSAKLLGVQAEYLTGGRAAPQPFPEQPGGPEVKTGEWVFVRIRNDSSQVLNITTLDLRPNWSIRQIYPAGAAFYEPLDPGHSLTLPLRAALPDGYDRGKDLIKVMATTGPSNFRWLELPEINDSQERVVWRCEPGTKLEEFLKAFMQDGHSLRDFNSEGAASHEWTSTQIEIHIRKV
jgi:hypothetical protein